MACAPRNSVSAGGSSGTVTSVPISTSCLTSADYLLAYKGSAGGNLVKVRYDQATSCDICSCTGGTSVQRVYDYAIWAASTIYGGETIFKTNIRRQLFVPTNFSGSRATLEGAPTSSINFIILNNTVTIATVNFGAASTSGGFSSITSTALTSGTTLTVKAPTSAWGARGLAMTLLTRLAI